MQQKATAITAFTVNLLPEKAISALYAKCISKDLDRQFAKLHEYSTVLDDNTLH